METAIDRAERFSRYLKSANRKSDELIDGILDKLFDLERQSLLKQRAELRAELDQFERQYALESFDFYQKFEDGEMGDDIDFFDWSATWRMYHATLASLETLDSNLISL